MLMSGVLPPMPWMTNIGCQRKLSKPYRRVLTVWPFVLTSLSVSLTTLLLYIGKSASLSQAALSAMNIDVDTSRFLDIVSPFTTRTLKDRKGSNKENITKTTSSASIRGKSNIKSDFVMVESSEILKKVTINAADQSASLSSAASSSKGKHTRSQSQPKAVKSGPLPHIYSRPTALISSVSATLQNCQRPQARASRS
jgi:hypothetical protein